MTTTTHVDARALFVQFQGNDKEGPPSSGVNKLPEEVLLEIFDFYRKYLHYDRRWNRIDGWFKLAHVCRKWRQVVLASSCRLDLRLFLTEDHHINAAMMRRLPPLPIVLHYWMGVWTARDHDRIVAALKYCDRVREIAFMGSGSGLDKFLKATKRSFPALESLKLCHASSGYELKLPHKFLGGSAPRLRSLKLKAISLASLSQLLSFSTELVDLSLGIDTFFGPSTTTSLVSYLQGMPCLRRLNLDVQATLSTNASPSHPTKTEVIVPLPELTCFYFSGHGAFLEALVAGFAAPALKDLYIVMRDKTSAFPISHLSRFIHDIEQSYHAARVDLSRGSLHISLLTCSQPIDHPEPPLVFCSGLFPHSMTQMGNALSAGLVAVEELHLIYFSNNDQLWQLSDDSTQWRRLFGQFRSVRILMVPDGLVREIAHTLRPDHGEPLPDPLPALEEIELHLTGQSAGDMTESQHASVLEAFQPFVAERQRAGRPVKVHWKLHKLFVSSPAIRPVWKWPG